MADQHRWFKLWCSAPADDSLQSLPPDLRWAWAAFGCYTKLHGTHGTISVSPTNAVLAAEMGVPLERLVMVLRLLPHVRVTDLQNHHGEFTVTWLNWVKYQEDSTQAARQMSRRKKRREEIRKEVVPNPETTGATPVPKPDGFSATQNGLKPAALRYPTTESEYEASLGRPA